eukprot:tig00020902_g14981.t1
MGQAAAKPVNADGKPLAQVTGTHKPLLNYSHLVNAFAKSAVAAVKNDGSILACNTACAQMFAGDIEGQSLWEVLASLHYAKENKKTFVEESTPITTLVGTKLQGYARRKVGDRSLFSLEIEFNNLAGDPENPVFLTNFRELDGDTDELAKLQKLLEESEVKRNAVIDTASDGVIVIDQDGIVRSFNKAASKMWGLKPSEVVGNNVKILMPEQFAKNHDQYLANYHATGKAKVIGTGREVPACRPDGSLFPIGLSVSPPVEISGTSYFVGIARDRTKRKLAEKMLTSNVAWVENMCYGSGAQDLLIDEDGNIHYKTKKAMGE